MAKDEKNAKNISKEKHVQGFQSHFQLQRNYLPKTTSAKAREKVKFITRKIERKSLYSLSDGFCHSNAAQNNLSPQGLCDGIRGQGQQNLSLTSAKIIHSFIFFNMVSRLSQWDTVTALILS